VTPEGKVKKKIREVLDTFTPVWYYMPVQTGYGVQGIPDFIICAAGRFFTIEAKADTKVTALQERTMVLIADAGGVPLVFNAAMDVSVLEAHLKMLGCHHKLAELR